MEGLYSAVKVSFIRRGNIQCTVLKCMYKLFIYVQGFETIIEELIATLEMRNNNKITVPFFSLMSFFQVSLHKTHSFNMFLHIMMNDNF